MVMEAAFSLVLEALQGASSQQATVLKPAEASLQQWETEKGFYSILINVFSNQSMEINVRWLAVLYLKNGVDRYWRKTAPNAISEDEKMLIRQGLLSNCREPVKALAIQLAVLISKVARVDWPREWNELMPSLINNISSPDPVIEHCALLTMHHVIKALSSKRLAGDRRLFNELTQTLLAFITDSWDKHLQHTGDPSHIDRALLCLRILRKLLVHGLKKLHENSTASTFLIGLLHHLNILLPIRNEGIIVHATKILLDVLEHHPFSFVCVLLPSLSFATSTAFNPQPDGLVFERLIVQCLNIIKMVLLCAEYKPSKVLQEVSGDPLTMEAHNVIQNFFNESMLEGMCTKLVGHYFRLTEDDLQLWDSNPEGFAVDEGGESWKYSLRPCTESLFACLFREFRPVLTPVLLSIVRSNTAMVDTSNLHAILHKDAIYSAVGLAAFDLFDDVDFDEWFMTTLHQEVSVNTGHYRILRRRVAWLIGEWVGVRLSVAIRPNVYECLVSLMQPTEDMVVRLTAANAMKMCVDNFEFNCEQFLPFLQSTIDLLFIMLKETKEADCKMQILHVLSFVIERMGSEVTPYSTSLGQYLPLLWTETESNNQYMVQCAILTVLINLVRAVRGCLSPLVVQAVANATDMTGSSHVYLMEDGLELWLALVENSKPSNQIMDLYNNMPAVLESSSENLRTCLHITQAYILLNPQAFLSRFGQVVSVILCDMMSDMRTEGIIMICRVMETALKVSAQMAAQAFQVILPRVIKGVLQREESPILLGMYLSIIARLLITCPDVLQQVMLSVSSAVGIPPEGILGGILDIWLERMAGVSQVDRRKLLAMALTTLITVNNNILNNRIHLLLLCVAETLHDVVNTEEIEDVDCAVDLTDCDSDGETEHERRKRLASVGDTVQRLALADVVKSQMTQLLQQVGLNAYRELLDTVDAETLQHLRTYNALP